MKILKSGEDYLEAIYNLSKNNSQIRSIDIAKTLNVTKASTFNALKILAKEDCIEKEYYGAVTLTEKGLKLAKSVEQKHKAITKLLIEILKVTPKIAEIDACKIEHNLSEETTRKLFEFLKIAD